MSSDLIEGRFPDENKWPFIGRDLQLDQCLTFLTPTEAHIPSRLLRIAGESGVGKSFFVKELICCFAERAPSAMCLYIDIEESEFESVDLEKRLAVLASYPMKPSRRDPQQVPTEADLAKYLRPLPRWLQVIKYLYPGMKRASAEIPLVGKFIDAFLPTDLPVSKKRELAVAGRFWDYLIATTRRHPVLLVIDNFQFLPESLTLELDAVFAIADTGFRLVVVDRLQRGISQARTLRCFGSHRLSLELKSLSYDKIQELVHIVLGEHTAKLPEISDVIFRKSYGNPKQVWLQLRALQLDEISQPNESIVGGYEETIVNLPPLDRLTLQLVTLLMGGVKLDDIVEILRWIVHPLSEDDIRRAILDLALIGLLIVNGTQNDRVRTEHELVRSCVRRTTTEQEVINLRQDVIAALNNRLEHAPENDEYDRLVDRLVGLLSPEDLRARHDLLAHLIALIDRQRSKERFHYLISLYNTPCCRGAIDLLPPHCQATFLDAFQKTSQFDKGLAAVELMRGQGKLSQRKLTLFAAKYLVQKFEYGEAESLLRQLKPGSDRDVILFNILLNLCQENEARRMISALPRDAYELDEFQCVMLRNAGHLYDEKTARMLLTRAKKGFKHHRLKFGEATTLNNIGVLEIWAGKYGDARRHLTAARDALDALESNEVYQPLSNLAVLCALEGDPPSAENMIERARAIVSPWLRMDDILLRFNRLVVDLTAGKIRGADAAVKANELYHRSVETKDLRFQNVLSWFANRLETKFIGHSSIRIPHAFDTRIRHSRCAGIEVFYDTTVENQKITLVFALSPHWRY